MSDKRERRGSIRRVSFLPISKDSITQENSIMNDDENEIAEMSKARIEKEGAIQRTRDVTAANTDRSSRIATMYSAVVKLSNENKINQKNTWNLDLINHMEDVLVDNVNGEETNFQKASTTLDASVKIYGYRVDDTLNTGYRMLDSLNQGEPVAPTVEKTKQSRKLGIANTLETNVSKLEMDMNELCDNADPMFHLMSKRFDEGGVNGLLLTNLEIKSDCSLVFDSNAVVEIEASEEVSEETPVSYLDTKELLTASHLDIEELKKEVCPQIEELLKQIEKYDASGTSLRDIKEIIPASLQDISQIDDVHTDLNPEIAPIPINSLDSRASTDHIDAGNDMDMDMDMDMDGIQNTYPTQDAGPSIEKEVATSSGSAYTYFKPSFLKSWAGPSHWHIEKVKKAKKSVSHAQHPRKPTPHIAFSPDQIIKPSITFAACKRPSDICYSEAAFDSNGNHTLPEDHHFSFDSLLQLECRQDISLRRNVNYANAYDPSATVEEWEISEKNVDVGGCSLENPMDVLQTTKDHGDEDMGMDMDMDMGDAEEESNIGETQPGFISEIEDSIMEENKGLGELLQADRVVKKITIPYASQSTQVDIQLLKKKIWKCLEKDLQDKNGVDFADLIAEVKSTISKEIAVQFFFICLLHISFCLSEYLISLIKPCK